MDYPESADQIIVPPKRLMPLERWVQFFDVLHLIELHDKHTVFGRAEYAEKDELFETGHPLFGETFTVGKLSVGYVYDIPLAEHITLGLGGLGAFMLCRRDSILITATILFLT